MVSTGARSWVEPLVRQLIGDGIAQTIVTPDDLPHPGSEPDLHGHALWELGVGSEGALAVTSSARGLRAAAAAKLATLVVTTPYTAGQDFTGAVDGAMRLRRAAGLGMRDPAPPVVAGQVVAQPLRIISMTALKSLSAWSVANVA